MGREPPKTTTPHNLPHSGASKFIGRDGDLENLHAQLQAEEPVVISAISGMGGIGKSELALWYAYQNLNPTYRGGILWIRARDNIGLQILNFARIDAHLEPPLDWEPTEQVQWCWRKWREATTLIVFDDVQDYEDIRVFLPPSQSQFRVLLTSREKFPSPVQKFEIQVLQPADALRLLGSFDESVRSRIARDAAAAENICKWLGYLPLGLELVGRYLARKPDLALDRMWERLQAKRLAAQALQAADSLMTANLGVIAAFELSWQELTPAAQQVAARLSLFAPAEIPWELVEACLSDWDTEQLEDLRDEELLQSSLLNRTGEGIYELHSLLREFFAIKLQAIKEREEFTRQFAQALTEKAKTIPQIVTLEWQTNLILAIPHLAAATEFSVCLEDDDKTWCCTALGRFYQTQSQFIEAEKWYQKSLAIKEEQLGANHPDTATSLNNLAGLYESIGRYGEAEPLYVRALAIREEQLGANHPDTAGSLNNLAGLYESIGRYGEAEPLYVRALAIREEQLGANHPDTAGSLNNLAGLYRSIGRYGEAEPLYVRALAIREEQLGTNHPDTAGSLNNLAGLYESIGRYGEAEPLYVRAIEILEQSLGTDHPNTQTCRENLEYLRRKASSSSLTWREALIAIPLVPFYLAYLLLRQIGKGLIISLLPLGWVYRQLRLWLKRRGRRRK